MSVKTISAKEAHEAVQSQKAVLVDVREESELREEGLATPALWLATFEIEMNTDKAKKFISALPKDKTVIVYCKAGGRAERFAEQLLQMGFSSVANMGGFDDWLAAKLPVKKL